MLIEITYIVLLHLLIVSLFLFITRSYGRPLRILTPLAIISVSVIVRLNTHFQTYFYYWIGLVVALMLGRLLMNYIAKKKSAQDKVRRLYAPPKTAWYKKHPYIIFGLLVYVFVAMDRVLEWIDSGFTSFDFKGEETGLALLMFLLLGSLIELANKQLGNFINKENTDIRFLNERVFNTEFINLYKNQIQMLLGATSAMGLFLYMLFSFPFEGHLADMLPDNTVDLGLWGLSCLSFFFMAWGLLNCFYLFKLEIAHIPLRAVGIGLLTKLALGMVLGQLFGADYRIIATLFASWVFMMLTLRGNMARFRNMDFYGLYA
ncbi:hypothetical protein [Sediminicola luteus]|uniref:Uncharacterized protein n=1 Tax=Sediminicola luteus TaxID=319238 RepID=A0A2A4GCT8_9FLAO|nr:hypothetical protein [Sediminicola luteus]PCE66273.1 hypothetical protein B7P33_02955 [Sediminicola luteus]